MRRFVVVIFAILLTACTEPPREDPRVDVLERACARGDVVGCEELAVMYLNGEAMRGEGSVALDVAELFCDIGVDQSCLGGSIDQLGRDPTAEAQRELALAAPYLRRACDLDSGESCYRYGLILHNGQGLRQDRDEALNYFARGCRLRSAQACAFVEEAQSESEAEPARRPGLPTVDPEDPDAALIATNFAAGCERNEASACYEYAAMLRAGVGVSQDEEMAVFYFTKACELGSDQACALER